MDFICKSIKKSHLGIEQSMKEHMPFFIPKHAKSLIIEKRASPPGQSTFRYLFAFPHLRMLRLDTVALFDIVDDIGPALAAMPNLHEMVLVNVRVSEFRYFQFASVLPCTLRKLTIDVGTRRYLGSGWTKFNRLTTLVLRHSSLIHEARDREYIPMIRAIPSLQHLHVLNMDDRELFLFDVTYGLLPDLSAFLVVENRHRVNDILRCFFGPLPGRVRGPRLQLREQRSVVLE